MPAAMPPRLPLHIRRKKAKGRYYFYFDTGVLTKQGTARLMRIDPPGSAGFAKSYASMMGARNRRESLEPVLMLPDLVQRYQDSQAFNKLATGTRHTYGIYLRQLAHALNRAPAKEVTSQDLYEIIDQMADRPAAANMVVFVANNVYAWGGQRGYVDHNPAENVALNEGGEYEPWPEALLAEALGSDDPRIRLPVHLLYYTAQRIGDVCALRWSDLREGVIFCRQQKTGKDMTIPVHEALQAELARTPKLGMTILAKEDGKPMRAATVREWLKLFGKARGTEVVPHGLRKNAVNSLLESGCSVGETSSISGQSLKIVEHYAKRRNTAKMASAAILRWERNR